MWYGARKRGGRWLTGKQICFIEQGYRESLYHVLTLYRPKEFAKKQTHIDDSDEEESTVGKMPPADSDDE